MSTQLIRPMREALHRYTDNERPYGECYDCHRPYDSFPDMLVPDAVWEIINPTMHVGAGLLCPTCIAGRCSAAGLDNVPVAFASTPLRSVPYQPRAEGENGVAWLNAQWPYKPGARGHVGGHPTRYDEGGGVWRYEDTDEVVDPSSPRPCSDCGQGPTPDGHDACLGALPGVSNACCGHGLYPPFALSDQAEGSATKTAGPYLGSEFEHVCTLIYQASTGRQTDPSWISPRCMSQQERERDGREAVERLREIFELNGASPLAQVMSLEHGWRALLTRALYKRSRHVETLQACQEAAEIVAAMLVDAAEDPDDYLTRLKESAETPWLSETALVERVRHYKGGTYTIMSRPLREVDLTPAIVYRSDADGREWERTAEDFNEPVLWPDGVVRPRFIPLAVQGGETR